MIGDHTRQRLRQFYDLQRGERGHAAEFTGPPERRTIKIKEGQPVDFALVSRLLAKASETL